jgi:hypothetical protein
MEREMLSNCMSIANAEQSFSNEYPVGILPRLIVNMKQGASWVSGKLTSIILQNSPGKQVLLIALHDETEIDCFQVNNSVTLRIIEGALQFYTTKESFMLRQGQFFTLSKKEKFSLTTIEETILLMTIMKSSAIDSKKQKVKRVQNVIA